MAVAQARAVWRRTWSSNACSKRGRSAERVIMIAVCSGLLTFAVVAGPQQVVRGDCWCMSGLEAIA